MHYVYLLQSKLNQSLYIGYTENPPSRVKTHNDGGNTSTKAGRPWKLIYLEGYLDKRDALGREKFLKSGSGYRYLRKQLRHYLEPGADPVLYSTYANPPKSSKLKTA